MSWSRCSDWIGITLLLVLTLALTVGSVGAAPQVEQTEGPTMDDGAEVGSSVQATFEIENPFDDISQSQYTFEASTNLTDASWTITTFDSSGGQLNRFSSGEAEISSNVARIEVSVSGTVPEVAEFDYAAGKESFVLASFAGGGLGEFSKTEAYHYTTGEEDSAGSKEAREALDAAKAALDDAKSSGAGVSGAQDTFDSAKSSYNEEAFRTAKNDAEDAESKANSAASSAQLQTYALYGVVAIVLIGGIGGFVWYRKQQSGPADPLR